MVDLQERVSDHRNLLYARCEDFRSMFTAGFKEGDGGEIPIEGTYSAAFKVLLKYLYTWRWIATRCSLI
jgi:hypothetical protein